MPADDPLDYEAIEDLALSSSEEESGDEAAAAAELGLEEGPAEFYDPDADDKNEAWMARRRGGRPSDALLSCPLCFTTVCVDCQQHAQYENQFRAVFVMNCRVDTSQVLKMSAAAPATARRRAAKRPGGHQAPRVQQQAGAGAEGAAPEQPAAGEGAAEGRDEEEEQERFNPVHCAVCDAELGLREVPPSGVYHFFNAFASTA